VFRWSQSASLLWPCLRSSLRMRLSVRSVLWPLLILLTHQSVQAQPPGAASPERAAAVVDEAVNFQTLPDPTRPAEFVTPRGPQSINKIPVLSSVLFSQDRRMAVIDGHVLGEGDSMNGMTVQRIDQSEVIVQMADNQEMSLKLSTAGQVVKRLRGSQWVNN